MKLIITVMVFTLLTACANQSTGTADPAVAVTPAAGSQSEKLVCQPGPTGSRLPNKKICKTKEEWAAVRSASQEATRNMQQAIVTQPQL